MKSHKQCLKDALMLYLKADKDRKKDCLNLVWELEQLCTPLESSQARSETEELLRNPIKGE